jgi:hypothetical protein
MCGNSTCHDCNQQPLCTSNDCSCPVKDLSTDCVLYTGADLACSGIKSGTILTDLIEQLDAFICQVLGEPLPVRNPTTPSTSPVSPQSFGLINIGDGMQSYRILDAQTNLQGLKEIRTIKSISDSIVIKVSSSDKEIEISEPAKEALKKISMSFDWKDSRNILRKKPQSPTLGVTDNVYRRGGFIGCGKPYLNTTTNEVIHPPVNEKKPVLIEADIYNLGIKIQGFEKIKDYNPVVVISKYTPTIKKHTYNPELIPGSQLEYFPETTYRKGSFKFSKDKDPVRLTRVPIKKGYQVIDFGQEHYFRTSQGFQSYPSLGGEAFRKILETRGTKKRYSQSRQTYAQGEAGFSGKRYNLDSAFVYLQFHIEITVGEEKFISPALGKLKMVASLPSSAIKPIDFKPGSVVQYDYIKDSKEFTKIRFKHT